jgi:formamidopyrimidine-DNA glycosylase
MPELPEVENIRRALEPHLAGKKVAQAAVRGTGLRVPFPTQFAERLKGATIRQVSRRAKYIIAELSTEEALLVHLGMTGRWRLERDGKSFEPGAFYYQSPMQPKHDHVTLQLEDGTALVYNDTRRFGVIDLHPMSEVHQSTYLRSLGLEPTPEDLDIEKVRALFAARRSSIKATLLDQKVIAGIGNIYASEILYRAKIHPLLPTHLLSSKRAARQLQLLLRMTVEVLENAVYPTGEPMALRDEFKVYEKAGRACARRGCGGKIRRQTQNGRSSYFCPSCQKK